MKTPSPERLKRGRAAVIGCSRTDCRICIEVCPFLAVSAADGAPYSDPDKCVGCGGCAAACPDSAIRLVRDRGDGSAELTYPFDGELPEIGAGVTVHPLGGGGPLPARVLQTIPLRPNTRHALVRAAVSMSDLLK